MSVVDLTRHERGAAALIVAISILLIMGFAALVIDLGAGFNNRAQDQSAADAASLGGAVESFLTMNNQNVLDKAIGLVSTDVNRTIPNSDWVACQDSGQLALTAATLGLTPATDCISWTGNYQEIRVRVPNQDVPTTFGRVLGSSGLAVSAAAQATVGASTSSNSPPLVVTSDISAGQEVCLRTSPSSTPLPADDPCNDSTYDPDSQFFGALLPYVYADPVTGDVICDSNEVSYSLAAGIDHTLSSFDPDFVVGTSDPLGSDVREEGLGCTGTPKIPQANPNTMPLNTGLSAQELRCGLLTAKGGVCDSDVPGPSGVHVTARLQSGDFMGTSVLFLEEQMDNKPLWDFFIDPLPSSAPLTCRDLQSNLGTWTYDAKKTALLDCLDAWSAGDGALFASDTPGDNSPGILDEPRFFFLPYLAESNLSTQPSACLSSAASNCVHFNSFVPVYLQATYSEFDGGQSRFDCDPGGNSKRWGIHQAGEPGDCGRDNDNLDRISGIVLACGMFPTDICEPDDSGSGGSFTGSPVLNVRLSK